MVNKNTHNSSENKSETADRDLNETKNEDSNKPIRNFLPKKIKKEVNMDSPDLEKLKKSSKRNKKEPKENSPPSKLPKRVKKEAKVEDQWKWWEEHDSTNKVKWTRLEHKGPVFPPEYVPLPENVKMKYNGEEVILSPEAEEVAGFYARMLDHEYTSMETFRKNFFEDWRSVMSKKDKKLVRSLDLCDFKPIQNFYLKQTEERKAMTKEEKQAVKESNLQLQEDYGYCILDGHREKIGNFRIEPPGLFRGRGNHPKMGKLKSRIHPEDVTINCSALTTVVPPSGHRWKDVIHDNNVSFLASWTEPILSSIKYIMLGSSSKLKGVKDMEKYEVARRLHSRIEDIRKNYNKDFISSEMRIRQRAVALYFIDQLALRAGNEKDEDTADTVGCCSLRVEHVTLHDGLTVEFDFLGKDSIRYQNKVAISSKAYKNMKKFMKDKKPEDSLFDSLTTSSLNKYLQDLMPGLTAKVFRTYNASRTLEEQLNNLTDPNVMVSEKVLSYNRANRAVAILCNHQRSVPKTFAKSMDNMQRKISEKHSAIEELKKQVRTRHAEYITSQTEAKRKSYEAIQKKMANTQTALEKLKMTATDRDESKQIAMGTSKLNYLDPRISVSWCCKNDVPIEKIYNKTQRDKFRWAIEMTDEAYHFVSI